MLNKVVANLIILTLCIFIYLGGTVPFLKILKPRFAAAVGLDFGNIYSRYYLDGARSWHSDTNRKVWSDVWRCYGNLLRNDDIEWVIWALE